MTTDTTELQERVAEELYYDRHPEGRHRGEWPDAVYSDDLYEYRDLAAAVLPIIARVRRDAAREALDGLAIDLAVTSGYTEAEEVRDYRDAHYPKTED